MMGTVTVYMAQENKPDSPSGSALRRVLRSEDNSPPPRYAYWQGIIVGSCALIALQWSFERSLWAALAILAVFALIVVRQAGQLDDF